jgi:hypothetical protein
LPPLIDRELMFSNPEIAGAQISADGKFTKIYSCSVFETCNPIRFNRDNRRVYMISNKGQGVDLMRLVLFDPETGKEEPVESDPTSRVDLEEAAFSKVTDELIFTLYIDDRQRFYFKDRTLAEDYKFLQRKLPNREISFDSSTRDEMTWLISAVSDTEPGESAALEVALTVTQGGLVMIAGWKLWGPLRRHLRKGRL